MTQKLGAVEIAGRLKPGFDQILTPEALDFLGELHRQFNPERIRLLQARAARQSELDAGKFPNFLPETAHIRENDWQVAPAPADLTNRQVEITGPVERKMMINALNSGAKVFMADFEDALSPTWDNVIEGQLNLKEAVRKTLSFENPDGKRYELKKELATLVVRPRGWHLHESHAIVDGEPMSASLFDFGLYSFHNGKELLARGSGPYFYLPKMESHLEARLWNEVFTFAQNKLGIPHGSIRATVLIETILAAFEMDEILFELRDHAAGLNAGRWDYIFSIIKKFNRHSEFVLPDRAQVTMFVPFMKAYCHLLVQTCHRRGAHAMGGMAAFIPSRKDKAINDVALAKVREDKERETNLGFDGTWVAHPDLVPAAAAVFKSHLGEKPHQKDLRPQGTITASELLNMFVDGGKITEQGVRSNIRIALQYIESWLQGVGAAAINNLMEDAATAEISRAQLWQWIHTGAQMESGDAVTQELYKNIREEELKSLDAPGRSFAEAARLLDSLVLSESFAEFLTIPAYELLRNHNSK